MNENEVDERTSLDRIKSILIPVADQIAELRDASDIIVFVIHRPGNLAKRMMRTLKKKITGKTTVFGMSCREAEETFRLDPSTSQWCSMPPQENEIKIFLSAGNGTAILSLRFQDG